jgi:hypothetical protein
MKKTSSILNFLLVSFCILLIGSSVDSPGLSALLFAGYGLNLKYGFMPKGVLSISMIAGEPITFVKKAATVAIIDPAFNDPELKDLHTIVPGIVADTQVAFMGRISKITKLDPGCGSGKTTKAIPLSEKTWQPKRMKIWSAQCSDDLEATFFVWGLDKGYKRKQLDSGEFAKYALEIMTSGVKEDALRSAWFGNTTVDEYGSGGTLLDAADIVHYNQLDGFWKKIFTAVGAGSMTNARAIAANSSASFVDQDDDLAADEAYKTFNALLSKADPRLIGFKGKQVIYCTNSLWQNWLTYKETQSMDMSFVRQGEYYSTDKYRGVMIVNCHFMDRHIRADHQDGVVWDIPHRALYTLVENLQIGLDTESVADFKVWYNDDTEETNWKGLYKMDVQIPHDFLTIVAY